ncbi:carbohydrate-binding family 9-like protein [Planctomycetota bacterium]
MTGIKRWIILIPILTGLISSEYFLWEYSGRKLETIFGSGVVNDQMAKNVRESMTTTELETFLKEMGGSQEVVIMCYKELAEKEINLASICRKMDDLEKEEDHLQRASGYYWTILETYPEGFDIIEISRKLYGIIDIQDHFEVGRLVELLERFIQRGRDPIHHRSVLGFLAELNHDLKKFSRERVYLEELIYKEKSDDYQRFIDLMKVYLAVNELDLAESIYSDHLRDQIIGNAAIFDASLDMANVLFRRDRTEKAMEISAYLFLRAEDDQRRVQTASQTLQHLAKQDREEAESMAAEMKQKLNEEEWRHVFDGELWVLGLRDSTVKKQYRVERVRRNRIRVDGRLTESCWNDNFMDRFMEDAGVELTREPVKAWIRYDSERIYFAFHCEDPDIEHLVADNGALETSIWKDDCVEIFIDTQRSYRKYHQFIVSVAGRKADWYNRLASYQNDRIDAKIFINKEAKYWEAEIAFYIEDLAGASAIPKGTVWTGNVCRDGYYPEDPDKPVEEFFEEYYYASYWSDCQSDNHQPQRWAYFVFE